MNNVISKQMLTSGEQMLTSGVGIYICVLANEMRIAVMSDLHLECAASEDGKHHLESGARAEDQFRMPGPPAADFVVLAGDIHKGSLAFDWVRQNLSLPTIFIGGNHEPFGNELFQCIALNREKSKTGHGRTIYLERATWEGQAASGERVRFIGATLWTNFELYNTPGESMAIAERRLADFALIRIERGYHLRTLRPSDTVRLHRASVEFIEHELEKPFPGCTIVVTHHAPSPRSLAPESTDHALCPAFASKLDDLVRTFQPTLWIHGHVHTSSDYMIGGTRVVNNPRGYFPRELNPRFDPNFVVDTASF